MPKEKEMADLEVQENKKQQMKLKTFCDEFDIPRTTVLKWVHSEGFPAYNLCGRWYIDIDKYIRWRELQHKKSYKYI